MVMLRRWDAEQKTGIGMGSLTGKAAVVTGSSRLANGIVARGKDDISYRRPFVNLRERFVPPLG